MALTKCKECGHDVSTTAAACPIVYSEEAD